jgi:Amt family ammonium transporter
MSSSTIDADGFAPDTVNVNDAFDAGNVAWIIVSTALVLLMIPGVGFFYSGLARRKSALSLIYLSMMSVGIVSFRWCSFGATPSPFPRRAASFSATSTTLA